ncbi:MAG TPA: OmpA family protein [Geminicoccaceae bacterium]|nr:OmpA family protein [Geminicoccaceae bacterium]
MFRQVITCSAAVGLVAAVAGSSLPSVAQDAEVVMFGTGPDRVCNTLITKERLSVLENDADAVFTEHTYDCPEQMVAAVIEPAAPPPEPLPGSGVVFFEFDRAELTPDAEATLSNIIADIQGRDLGGITVGGHADTAGPAEYNMQLSERRANNVAGELIRAGIPATIVTTEAFGETDLAVDTPDNTPAQPNRRATIDFAR